ncbi:beta-galactosidase GalB [uncultured Draconibacterium sp.]|uniref:beta-galactosidase GalB n=1 Tax=uncultured Draconibacterium sp. TaxID=1573823 RepID=UPI00326080C4
MKMKIYLIVVLSQFVFAACSKPENARVTADFNDGWKFLLSDDSLAFQMNYDDSDWRELNLPHDWSIEGEFSNEHPAGNAGGALPGGIGWYRKSFKLEDVDSGKHIFIEFDGIYQNSEVWINGEFLGERPYGYSAFQYDLTPYLKFGEAVNVIAVRVDNSLQPNSRWYTGSGIYRNVWLVKTGQTHVKHWGTFVQPPEVSAKKAIVEMEISLENASGELSSIETIICNSQGEELAKAKNVTGEKIVQRFEIENPALWSVEEPNMYLAKTAVYVKGELCDNYETPFGIRRFYFDAEKGFFLNGESLKLHGVNHHHDMGALGAAVNVRAMERQLEIYKEMGVNAIRMAHNPPARELLDLCDKMGFLVMDEAFDMWAKKKNKYDYHLHWDEWHKRDLEAMVLRDRNHPSIFAWSVGNEIREQFDSTGTSIAKELVAIVKSLDTTRPVTCALTEQDPAKNFIYQSKALDLISFNYKHREYLDFPKNYPGEKMLASENMSALSTRGHYDMPSDEDRIWPPAYNVEFDGNPDFTVSAYDHVYAYWGSTHEDTWNVISNNDFISGMFIWSGFDYLGEPVPYPWPARSSYYGVIDLTGFPKDSYYLYQSLWTDEPMLHLFPHWNWNEGQDVDVWAYYNKADEVELFVNGISQGVQKTTEGKYHAMWRVSYKPGNIIAVSRKEGKVVLEKEIKTAEKAAKIKLVADRSIIKADGKDLSFISVEITDQNGIMVPDADNLVNFEVSGAGFIAGVDNGYQASHEAFKATHRKAFNGKCLLIVQSTGQSGTITITAKSGELEEKILTLKAVQ